MSCPLVEALKDLTEGYSSLYQAWRVMISRQTALPILLRNTMTKEEKIQW
jgi:hypothetical protein